MLICCTGEPSTNIVDCLKKGESERIKGAVVFAMVLTQFKWLLLHFFSVPRARRILHSANLLVQYTMTWLHEWFVPISLLTTMPNHCSILTFWQCEQQILWWSQPMCSPSIRWQRNDLPGGCFDEPCTALDDEAKHFFFLPQVLSGSWTSHPLPPRKKNRPLYSSMSGPKNTPIGISE
jgi:hypothetical protein